MRERYLSLIFFLINSNDFYQYIVDVNDIDIDIVILGDGFIETIGSSK
jgi:hypothetical protein